MIPKSKVPGKLNMVSKASKHCISYLPLEVALAVSIEPDEAWKPGLPTIIETNPL